MMTSTTGTTSPPAAAFHQSIPNDDKILHDLTSVSDQITLLTSMLLQIEPISAADNARVRTAIDSNPSILTVIGFLEACAPRMIELVQAGSSGGFAGEETLVRTLEVNDELCRVLKDVEDPRSLFERSSSQGSSAVYSGGGKIAASGGGGLEADFAAFGIDNSLARGGSGGGDLKSNSSALEDLLASSSSTLNMTNTTTSLKQPSTASSTLDDLLTLSTDGMSGIGGAGGGAAGAAKVGEPEKNGNEFDDFFGERMGGGSGGGGKI